MVKESDTIQNCEQDEEWRYERISRKPARTVSVNKRRLGAPVAVTLL